MPSEIILKNVADSTIPTPDTGKNALFFDTSPAGPAWKDDAGIVHPISGGGITSLTTDVVATGPGAAVATIQALAVTTGKIDNLAVTSGKIASDAVITAKILDDNVTLAKIANAAANSRVVGSGSGGIGINYTELSAGVNLAFGASSIAFEAGLTDEGNSGTADTIDFLSRYRWTHKSTLTGNVTYTLSNPAIGGVYTILIFTGAGAFTATWPGTVKWSGGTAPVITVTAARMDLVVLTWDGTNYYGSSQQNYTP